MILQKSVDLYYIEVSERLVGQAKPTPIYLIHIRLKVNRTHADWAKRTDILLLYRTHILPELMTAQEMLIDLKFPGRTVVNYTTYNKNAAKLMFENFEQHLILAKLRAE